MDINERIKNRYKYLFTSLADGYWEQYNINKFENSDIYKKMYESASNGEYELRIKGVDENSIRMLLDFGIDFTITDSYEYFNIDPIKTDNRYDIYISWFGINDKRRY